jgi:hypothetical protein
MTTTTTGMRKTMPPMTVVSMKSGRFFIRAFLK